MVTVPVDGPNKPQIIFNEVDLPEPFGPRSAVTPGPMLNERSETATRSPYHLETWSSTIVG